MPKLRADDTATLNVRELESATYDKREDYRGAIPPKNTRLHVIVKKAWWSETNPPVGKDRGDPMLKLLVVADGNIGGDGEEYEGLTMWENYALTKPSKWKWDPFLSHFGLTITDVKTRTFVADEDDNNGAPIQKIKGWIVNSDDARATIYTSREMYQGDWQAHVAEWLEYDPSDVGDLEDSGAAEDDELDQDEEDLDEEEMEDEDEDEELEDEPDEDEDDADEIEDEEEDEPGEEPEQEQVTRGRRAAAAARPTRTGRSAPARPAATPAARGTRTGRSATPAAPAPARSGRAKAAAAPATPARTGRRTAAKPAPAAPAGRGRRARGSSQDPPF